MIVYDPRNTVQLVGMSALITSYYRFGLENTIAIVFTQSR